MQKLITRIASMLAVLAITLGTSSCEKIDDLTADPKDIKSINAVYTADLSQTWFDYFDIMVTYYDEAGQPQTLQIFERWSYSISLPPKKAPHNYAFTVTASPKENHPGLENVTPITFSRDIKAEFFAYRYDGSIVKELASQLCAYTLSDTQTYTYTRDSEFKNFFNNGRRTLLNFTKSWDGGY